MGTHEKILAVSIQVFFDKKTIKYAQNLEFSVLWSEVSTKQTFHDVQFFNAKTAFQDNIPIT